MASRKARTAAAIAKRDRAKKHLDETIAELHEAIVADLADGWSKVELAAIAKVSRERIRLIENEVRDRQAKEQP